MDDHFCIDSSSLYMSDCESTLLHNLTTFFSQAKSMEELKQALVLTHMELEATRNRAHQELRNRDHQLTHLQFLLSQAKEQTDESHLKFKALISQTITLQTKLHHLQVHTQATSPPHPPPPPAGVTFEYDESGRLDTDKLLFQYQTTTTPELDNNTTNNGSSDSDESIVSSPGPAQDPTTRLVLDKPLPEKGKLLMAVMQAGPLLQTLLLAGPLPQWRHPPPPLDSYQIPPPPVVVVPITNPSPPQEQLVGKSDDCVRMMRKTEACPDFGLHQNKRPRLCSFT